MEKEEEQAEEEEEEDAPKKEERRRGRVGGGWPRARRPRSLATLRGRSATRELDRRGSTREPRRYSDPAPPRSHREARQRVPTCVAPPFSAIAYCHYYYNAHAMYPLCI